MAAEQCFRVHAHPCEALCALSDMANACNSASKDYTCLFQQETGFFSILIIMWYISLEKCYTGPGQYIFLRYNDCDEQRKNFDLESERRKPC